MKNSLKKTAVNVCLVTLALGLGGCMNDPSSGMDFCSMIPLLCG